MKRVAISIVLSLGACTDAMPGGNPDAGTATPRGFTVQIQNVAPWTALKSGWQTVKESGASGVAGPGDAFDITFTAGKKQRVSFAAMFGESNDWFFAPDPAGIALYDDAGNPRSGDVTSEVGLWNAGTEVDEEPGVGPDTGPHQATPDQGAPDPDPDVRAIDASIQLTDGTMFTRPAIDQMIQVTLTPAAGGQFTLRIANVSTPATLVTSQGARAIHVSPVVWAVHTAPGALFDADAPDRGQGLELVAESGRGAMLSSAMRELSGAATPISPGVWMVHGEGDDLFDTGLADPGMGLERLAESGNPMPLATAMSANVVDTPDGATSAGAARPGQSYTLHFDAVPGDRLSWAAMFGMSDDWFFATAPGGLPLFDEHGAPIAGDVTSAIGIYDAGTEIDEELAIGGDTGPQQTAPDQGAHDPVDQVRPAAYPLPASAHLRVIVTPDAP